jgi:hypothetical protein
MYSEALFHYFYYFCLSIPSYEARIHALLMMQALQIAWAD